MALANLDRLDPVTLGTTEDFDLGLLEEGVALVLPEVQAHPLLSENK